jgi:hypothetical protein
MITAPSSIERIPQAARAGLGQENRFSGGIWRKEFGGGEGLPYNDIGSHESARYL